MPNSVAKGRSRIALLAVLAVLASLFVLPAAPAGATVGKADSTATFTACPAGVIPDAGFADTTGSFAADNIDCIAYYGVTQGTSATTYSPAQVVTRWQMALFLVRAAGPAGITVPAASAQGFVDIAGLPQATQDAINQIAALGISKGTSATTFDPMSPVSRYQMALFLARFLSSALVGPGGTDIDSNAFTSDGTGFTDIGSVSFEAHNAIEDIFEMGVTTGTTATTFSPYAAVTREQMAAFITRTLSHTNARPAGVTIQASPTSGFGALNPNVSITYRDASFNAVANQLVDVFSKTVDTGKTLTAPLKADGTCDGTQTGDCTLSLADNATDSKGNIALVEAVASGKTTQWWAWTGTTGASFDADTTAVSTVTVSSSAQATAYKVTTTVPKNAGTTATAGTDSIVKMGSSVTITVQLVDAGGNAVAQSGQNVIFTDRVYNNAAEGSLVSQTAVTVKTDAAGQATYTVSQADPTTGDDTDFDEDISIGGVFSASDVELEWQDGTSVVSKLVLAQSSKYTVASDAGIGAAHTATGTVYDQYGAGVSSVGVQFSNEDELSSPVTRFTNSSGVATIGWNRDDATAEADTLSGVADVDGDLNFTVGVGEAIDDSGDLTVYWVVEEANGASQGSTAVLVADADNDAIVYDAASPTIVYYDSNDQFKVGGVAKTYADFDAAIAKDDGTSQIAVTAYAADPSGISQFDYTP